MPKNVPASDYTAYIREKASFDSRNPPGLFNSLIVESDVARGLPPPVPPVPPIPSVSYGIVSFPGEDYIRISGIDLPGSFTIEWFMLQDGNNTSTGLTVFDSIEDIDFDNGNDRLEVHVISDNLHVHNSEGDRFYSEDDGYGENYVDRKNWYHYALSGTSDSLRLYFNGNLMTTLDTRIDWTNKIFTTGYSFYNA